MITMIQIYFFHLVQKIYDFQGSSFPKLIDFYKLVLSKTIVY